MLGVACLSGFARLQPGVHQATGKDKGTHRRPLFCYKNEKIRRADD